MEKAEKVVNILGKGDGWDKISEAKEGVIYGCNDSFLRTPEVSVTFHMHDLNKFANAKNTASSTKLTALNANKRPDMEFYSIYKWPNIPHCKEYPLDEIINYFDLPIPYFTSTIEYMIAFALWRGCEIMNLYGCNMTVKQEYVEQKPGMEFWIGMAMGRGCKVNLQHEYTSLLKTRNSELYGYNMKQWRIK
jgi:hypothetical protein